MLRSLGGQTKSSIDRISGDPEDPLDGAPVVTEELDEALTVLENDREEEEETAEEELDTDERFAVDTELVGGALTDD